MLPDWGVLDKGCKIWMLVSIVKLVNEDTNLDEIDSK